MSSPLHYPMMQPSPMPIMIQHPGRLRAASHFSPQAPVQSSRSSTSHPSTTRYRADSDAKSCLSNTSRCSTSPEVTLAENPSETLCNGAIRCWSHGCNGREFSSLGNYRRHFREQHRVCKKFCCQRCGRTFSRSTARNVHFEKRKCRAVRLDDDNASNASASSNQQQQQLQQPQTSLPQDSLIESFSSPANNHYELTPPLSRNDSLDSIFPYHPQTPPNDLMDMSPLSSLYDFDSTKSQSPMSVSDLDASQWAFWGQNAVNLGDPALSACWEDFHQPMLSMGCAAPFLDESCMPTQPLDLQWMPR
nr:zinc finger protein 410 [Quercus suber]